MAIILLMAWLQFFVQPMDAAAGSAADEPVSITRVLSEVVADGQAPGAVAAIISSRGVMASGAAGVRKMGSDRMMTIFDQVCLGSCTKAMTCAMLATLVEDGKLGWDMTLIEVIPELKRAIHRDYHHITLWQLLLHRGGFPDCFTFDQTFSKEDRLGLLKDRLSESSAIEPDEFSYSNLGYVAAACMAETVTGKLWEDLMVERLFKPLGMRSAGFGFPGTRRRIDQPWGHRKSGNTWHPVRSNFSVALAPAGAVHCSIDDWAAFLSIFLDTDKSFLDADTLAKLVEPTGFYAAGWGIAESQPWAKGRAYSHNGSDGMWYASVVVAPALDRAYLMVINGRDFGESGDMCMKTLNSLIIDDLDIDTDPPSQGH
jgi:CubicO group peptidase (beta-lactamase class C family)